MKAFAASLPARGCRQPETHTERREKTGGNDKKVKGESENEKAWGKKTQRLRNSRV